MAEEVKTYRVFFASPGDCGREREIAIKTVNDFDLKYHASHNIHLEFLGWEYTIAPGGNRPQAEINKEVDRSDLFILCIYKKWGTPPGKSEYSSGTEEEFYRGWRNFERFGFPRIFAFFRVVDVEFLADPGEQLRKVIGFKDSIRAGEEPFSKKILYKEYYLPEENPEPHMDFEVLINKTIAKWLGGILNGNGEPPDALPDGGDLPGGDFVLKLAETEKALEDALSRIEKLEREKDLTVSENLKKNALELAILGEKLTEERNLYAAEAVFASAIRTFAFSPEVYGKYAKLLIKQKRYGDAVNIYDKIIDLDSNAIFPYNNKGWALNKLGDIDSALECFEEAIIIRPYLSTLHSNKAGILILKGRNEEALVAINRALELEPSNPSGNYNRGLVLAKLTRYEDSIRAYDEAIKLKSNDFQSINNKAADLNVLGNYAEGLLAAEAALAIKPDYHLAYLNKGNSLKGLEKYREAIKEYDKAINLKKDFHEAFNNKGTVLFDLGLFEESITAYDKAIALNPYFANPYYNKGNVLKKLERFEEAKTFYTKAISIEPKEWEPYFNRACLYALTGNKGKMLADLKKAVSLDDKPLDIAKADEDFEDFRDDPEFRRLIFPEEFEA